MFKATSRTPQPGSSRSKSEVKLHRRSSHGGPSSQYPYRLNFYTRSPTMDITLEEFELFAIARLKVLTQIHSLSERTLPVGQYKDLIGTVVKTHLPLSSNSARNVKLDDERRKDEISHWVLRLAFCRSPDLREKFVKTEAELFKQRFETDDATERQEFLKSLKFDWTPVEAAEKQYLKEKLATYLPKGTTEAQMMAEAYVKVPWFTVTELISSRKVYIQGGHAYVPPQFQIHLVMQAFKDRLSKALELTAKSLPRMDEDDRLMPILAHLSLSFLTNISAGDNTFFGETDPNSDTVTADMIDALASKHFPPCQYNLWKRLKTDNHLKYFGRLQFGLFIKAIGLPLEESLIFWRRAFGPSMTDDRFAKEYRYNIRHSYGQEGKRVNYPAKNCQQILTGTQPGPQDSHGCPFRHSEREKLSSLLSTSYGIDSNSPEMKEVLDLAKATKYHVACTRVFEITHPASVKRGEGLGKGELVQHPNAYYSASLHYEKESAAKKEPKAEPMQVD